MKARVCLKYFVDDCRISVIESFRYQPFCDESLLTPKCRAETYLELYQASMIQNGKSYFQSFVQLLL